MTSTRRGLLEAPGAARVMVVEYVPCGSAVASAVNATVSTSPVDSPCVTSACNHGASQLNVHDIVPLPALRVDRICGSWPISPSGTYITTDAGLKARTGAAGLNS